MNEMPRNSLTVGEIQKITYWLNEQAKSLETLKQAAINETAIDNDIKEIETLIARLEEQQIQ